MMGVFIVQGRGIWVSEGEMTQDRKTGGGIVQKEEVSRNDALNDYSEPNPEAMEWVKAGHKLEDEGKFKEAIEAFHKATLCDQNCALAYWGLWNSYSELGNPYESRHALAQAIAIEDRNEARRKSSGPGQLKNSIESDFNAGNLNHALENCDTFISGNPSDGEVWFIKGCCHLEQGDLDSSIGAFQKAVELDPGHFYAQNNLGVALGRSGRNQDAARALRQALSQCSAEEFEHFIVESNFEKAGTGKEGIPLDLIVPE